MSEKTAMIAGIVDPSDGEKYLHQEKWDPKKGFTDRFWEFYFRPKGFERSGRLYEALGIRYVKKLAMGTFGWMVKRSGAHVFPSNYFIGQRRTIGDLVEFEKWTRFNETLHQIFTPYNFAMLGYNISEGNSGKAAFFAGLATINTGLILLQRYNRARVYNTLEEKLG